MGIIIKLMVFILVFSVLNILRETFFFFKAFKDGKKLEITKNRVLMLALSLSFIITVLFTGLKF